MNRYPKNRHFNPVNPVGGGTGGGSSSGPANAIQISDGAGGFSNRGSFAPNDIRLPLSADQNPFGFSLDAGNSKRNIYLAQRVGPLAASGSFNIFNDSTNALPASSAFKLVVTTIGKRADGGTPSDSAFSFVTTSFFRKQSGASTLTKIGASVQTELFNDTGDAFVGNSSLNLNAGLTNVEVVFSLISGKTFIMEFWVEVIIVS